MMSSRVGQRWIFRSNSGWLGGDRITDLSVLTLCSALVLMGLVMLLKIGADKMQADASADWPTAFGTVLSGTAQLVDMAITAVADGDLPTDDHEMPVRLR